MKLKAQGAPIASSNSLFFLAPCLGCTQCSLHLDALLVFTTPKAPAISRPCSWSQRRCHVMGLLGPRDSEDGQSVAAKNDVPIRLLFVFQLLSSAAEGAAAADAAEPWPSLGMSCFFLKKNIDKIRVQGTLTASSSCFLCSLSALAAHNLQVISMRSLRSAKIPKGPGYQKAMQLVLAHSSFSMRLLRPRASKK